ncbi:VWA domain-containing protein [Xanthobacter dioxanivorans]|uniref:VWA domain-containing protein n=1 Tax=Xanthobacter dioxanivorans TaxID=2528964 RepID=A0A974PLR5_9HYPH|nr:VWA domain-containing protein [Xanthobacter dioxanivorans]QRG05330.1 VWA domain-containing protein [Xanthobacter dioxanivorans]
MGKRDGTSGTGVPLKQDQGAQVSRADEVERFLAAARAMPPARPADGRGRLAFALDATGSRQPTWTLACDIQADMFAAASAHGGLDMQIVYYRGGSECRASPFVRDAATLGGLMRRISCLPGLTQIHRVLGHLAREAERSGLKAAVFVGDALEEDVATLDAAAGQLALRGVRLFMFQEGDDTRVEEVFRRLAAVTGGAYCHFDARAAAELRQLLAAVAAYAAGGRPALSARNDAGARHLLAALGTGGAGR